MEINKPMTTRNMLASTLTDYKKPVKLPKITVELDPMLKKRFKAEAVRRGTTIRDMLTAWIEHDCPPLDAADARAEAKQDGRRSMMTDDIEERAALARRGIMDHSDCEDCTEDWTFLMRQGRREFPLGLRTVLACLAFAEREGAVPELPADWWVRINRRYR